MPSFSATVPADFSTPERLDKYVASVSPNMNRSRLKAGVTSVLLNGKTAKFSSKVAPGDVIDIEWEENIPDDIEPENIPLEIIYEDENVTVVNKPQGMVTHPAAGNWNGTLVNALLFHWGRPPVHQKKEGSPDEILALRRPGIVHRLDKDTSGILITAKNRESEAFLHNQFADHSSLVKEYIAICCGHPKIPAGKIETQIVRDPKNRKRFKAVKDSSDGKYACTLYSCFATYGPFSLMRLRIKTGRTHQIRVHMKYIGCPIMGDPIYGNSLRHSPFEKATMMLHSYFLKIRIPGKDRPSVFKSSVPRRFKIVLKMLHAMYSKGTAKCR